MNSSKVNVLESADWLQQIRQHALGYPNSEQYFPWKSRAFFRDLKGRNFLVINEQPAFLELIVRLNPLAISKALELPFVELHDSIGSKGWVTNKITSQTQLDTVLPWIATSYEYNKPFRTTADLLEGENPDLIEYLEILRTAALSYGEVEEYFPYGQRAFRRIKGQIFLYISEESDCLIANFRLPDGLRETALNLPFVEVP